MLSVLSWTDQTFHLRQTRRGHTLKCHSVCLVHLIFCSLFNVWSYINVCCLAVFGPRWRRYTALISFFSPSSILVSQLFLRLTLDTFVLSFLLLQLYSLISLPLPSSPSLKFSPFLAPPSNILSFLSFLCLVQFSSSSLFFLSPSALPFSLCLSSFPLPFHPHNVSPTRLAAPLLLLPVLAKWQKEAAESELAALATCIIHVPCSLCVGPGLLAFHWDTWASRKVCLRHTRSDGWAAQMGLWIL